LAVVQYRTGLIIGAGAGISASLARLLSSQGIKVGLVARDARKLEQLASETGALSFSADAADPAAMTMLFEQVDVRLGSPDSVI
jgi:NADP-dependent 3-hydroxy acid dehydrogenase YdfG